MVILRNFRSQTTAAPLKHYARITHCPIQRRDFRSQTTAAPLKLIPTLYVISLRHEFPQSNDCGPIEATFPTAAMASLPAYFRSQTTAAPLKPIIRVKSRLKAMVISAVKRLRPH